MITGNFPFNTIGSLCRALPPFVASKGQEKGNVLSSTAGRSSPQVTTREPQYSCHCGEARLDFTAQPRLA
jgi:hypothetical protein